MPSLTLETQSEYNKRKVSGREKIPSKNIIITNVLNLAGIIIIHAKVKEIKEMMRMTFLV